MGHGILGVKLPGFAFILASTGFFYYLSRSYTGPDKAKYSFAPDLVDIMSETQPAIKPEFYYKNDKKYFN